MKKIKIKDLTHSKGESVNANGGTIESLIQVGTMRWRLRLLSQKYNGWATIASIHPLSPCCASEFTRGLSTVYCNGCRREWSDLDAGTAWDVSNTEITLRSTVNVEEALAAGLNIDVLQAAVLASALDSHVRARLGQDRQNLLDACERCEPYS